MSLTFDEALERLNDGRFIHGGDVLARALARKVWVAEWHLPGCLSESRTYCLTKADALQAALDFAGDEAPRGMKTCLRRHGAYQHKTELYGTVVTTIEQLHLKEII
jgi:hypothetical protein